MLHSICLYVMYHLLLAGCIRSTGGPQVVHHCLAHSSDSYSISHPFHFIVFWEFTNIVIYWHVSQWQWYM